MKKFIPLISLIPILSIFLMRDNYNIITINYLTDNLFINIIIISVLLYGLNIWYRAIYSSKDQKKLISPLSFIFVANIIHQVNFFIAIVPLIQVLNFDFSSNIVIYYVFSVIVSTIHIYNFEIATYNQSSKNSILTFLEQAQDHTTLFEFVTIFLPIISLLLIGITDIDIPIDFSPLIVLLLWNILFTRIIRPQLFTYLKNE